MVIRTRSEVTEAGQATLSCLWRMEPGPAESIPASDAVSNRAQAREQFQFQEERTIAVRARADPVNADSLAIARIGNSLAEENGFVPRSSKTIHKIAGQVGRGTVGNTE